MVLTSRCYS